MATTFEIAQDSQNFETIQKLVRLSAWFEDRPETFCRFSDETMAEMLEAEVRVALHMCSDKMQRTVEEELDYQMTSGEGLDYSNSSFWVAVAWRYATA